MSDQVDLYKRAMAEFDRRVQAIQPSQWGSQTACSEWDVRALVRHLVYENVWVPPLFEGETIAQVGDRFEGDLLGDDPRGAWDASMKAALASVTRPGAMDDVVQLSSGPTKGSEYAMQLTTDLLVHAWDLAVGIGGDRTLDPEVAAACLADVRKSESAVRGSGLFADEVKVGADAGPQAQLLGFLGRTP